MSKPKQKRETPVVIGEQIADSQLYRRFQGTSEVSPLYVPVSGEASIVSNAHAAADKHGFRSVTVYDDLYVSFDGRWYIWAGFPAQHATAA
jgi:hypothetical protein